MMRRLKLGVDGRSMKKIQSGFTEVSKDYEKTSLIQKGASEILFELLKIQPFEDVLDLGCGPGHLTQKIKELTDNEFYFEHVTNYVYENEDIFKVKKLKIKNEDDVKNIRLTIDDEDDFNLSQTIYKKYVENNSFLTYSNIVESVITDKEKEKMIKQIEKNIK